ncbi:unnamed protein product (macronuclear) [Paramecium tetraurelia]|uniref:Rotatin N-terminal domain-containing protein n=1 Tax=Paramecium tetraurelia TaxID=5888 RepID=A0C819_PARTE|nr:uncharacterized protein GSPATT00036067001 [Paramecium tetraurelia]CAK66936.1 unnamed protein product [Paramecium tetraurelia]|eukprot:XP_001434333.1 hypothetical protein (macronuclear) [Paramecium tetraurelia strain d4-2]
MSFHQINKIIEKLQSCSLDVQQSAIRNLISKIQCGLVGLNELCDKNPTIGCILFKWIVNQCINTQLQLINQVIDLIKDLSKHHLVKQNLKSDIQIICEFRNKLLQYNLHNNSLDLLIQNVMEGESIQPIQNPDKMNQVVKNQFDDQIKILVKPDHKTIEYEYFPFVKLTEQDEKFLFDISVQLKFGNNQTILFTIKEQLWRALKDFPIEVFRSRQEIIEEVLILCNSQKDENIIYYSLIALQKFITNLTTRFSKNQSEQNYNKNQEAYVKDNRDHIVYSYPTLDPSAGQQKMEINQKTLKGQIDLISKQILRNLTKFMGRRINILFLIVKLLKKVSQINQDAAQDSVLTLINELTQIFDTNDESLHQQQLIPLYYISFELLTLLPEDFKMQSIPRFCSYLLEAQYANLFSSQQMEYLFTKTNALCPNLVQGKQHQQIALQTLELLFSNHYTTQHMNKTACEGYVKQLEDSHYILSLQFTTNQKSFRVPKQSVSIEELSVLETNIISQKQSIPQKLVYLDQLIAILIYYSKQQKEFLSQVQVKESLFKSYMTDLLTNVQKYSKEKFESFKNEHNYKIKGELQQLLCKFLDLSAVSLQILMQNQFDMAIYLLQQTKEKQSQLSAFRYLIVAVLQEELSSKDHFYSLSKLIFDYKGKSDQFWDNNIPLQNRVTHFLQCFLQLVLEGLNYQNYKQQQIYIKNSGDFIQSLDLLLALKANEVDISYDNCILDELKQLMSSTLFLSSGKTYVLNLISTFNETKSFWLPLLSYVHQCFLENVGEEQVEYLNLYIQLLSVVKQHSEVGKYIVKYQSKYPFNIKVSYYVLKLLKNNLLDLQPDLLKYLQSNIFQYYNHLNFENSNCLIKLLKLSRQFNLFQSLEPLDQQILFSRLIQLTKSHLQIIRFLSLNILSLNLKQLNADQINRIEDQMVDDLYQSNESQYIYSQSITIILKLKPLKKLTRVISYTENRLKSDIASICKAGLLRLVYLCLQYHKDEAIQQMYNLQIDHQCAQFLVKFKNVDQLFLTLHAAEILNVLMRQSVSKALSILQSYNLVETAIHSIHKLRKYLNCNQPNLIAGILLQLSLLLQFATHYHKDYVEFEYNKAKQTKPKWNIVSVISLALQNDNFSIDNKIGIAKILQCIYQIEFTKSINDDLIYSLTSIFRPLQLSDSPNEEDQSDLQYQSIIQILSAIVSVSNSAKLILCKTGVAKTIALYVVKELEKVINKTQQKPQKMQSSQVKNLNTSNVSFAQQNQLQQSPIFKVHVVFLKLLLKFSEEQEDYSLNSNSQLVEVIGLCIDAILKLLFLGFTTNSQIYFELMNDILINLGSNQLWQSHLSQQLSEQKWLLLVELKKHICKDQLTLFQNEVLLKALGILGQNSDVRQVYIRMKIIEEIQEKLNKVWSDKRKWQTNTQFNALIVQFMLSLSFYKETQLRILANNQFVNILQEILVDNDIQQPICQDILLIYSNCSLNGKLKKMIINNQQLSCLVMNTISETTLGADLRYRASQFLLNLMYKCTQAVCVFNKSQVFDCFEMSMKDSQRQIDKIQLTQNDNNQLISKQEDNNNKIRHLQKFLNNVNQLLKILKIEW